MEEKSTINPEPIVEYDTLKLYCHADGIPSPKVSWYFRKRATAVNGGHHHAATSSDHNVSGQSTRQIHSQSAHHHHHATVDKQQAGGLIMPGDHVIHEGSTLVIRNASRHQSGIYECIANNSVQPAASRKIKVSVECKLSKEYLRAFTNHLDFNLVSLSLSSPARDPRAIGEGRTAART